ncbi:MAG: hypothetical protein WBO21_14270 [Acidimicrobiia bacterium]
MDLSPALILATWVSGIAAGGAVVAWWRVVGPGYLWLVGAVVGAIGALSAAAGAGRIAWAGVVMAVVGALGARSRNVATPAFTLGTGFFLASVWETEVAAIAFLITGILFLGGITTEMMLGHWFLVDPTLPRWSLIALDAVAAVGLVLEVAVVVASGSLAMSGQDAVYGVVFVVLAVFCAVLMLGVWGSLREPRYSGVMAATGLSYLAVLVAFGVVTVGRSLVAGSM